MMSADIGWEEYQQICDKLSRAKLAKRVLVNENKNLRSRLAEAERERDAALIWRESENKALNKAVETMKAIVTAYDRDNPVRTADVHGAECTCMRCAVDAARAFFPPT